MRKKMCCITFWTPLVCPWSTVLHDTLTVPQLVIKAPVFRVQYITVFTGPRNKGDELGIEKNGGAFLMGVRTQ
jgi:hypothetical protein